MLWGKKKKKKIHVLSFSIFNNFLFQQEKQLSLYTALFL